MSTELKANLEKFISHCQDLKHEDDPSGDGFTREFRNLREKQVREKEENKFPAEEGKKHVNIKKNRYKDILPYDNCRVILQGKEEVENYINANYIEGINGDKDYIASQGPLPHTLNDFIRMLWQQKTEIVFMSCRLEEGEPKKKKCEKYWTDLGESKEFGEITVATEEETLPMKDFYRRRIRLSCDGIHHRVTQFHYIGWPDHGIPDHPSLLNVMINYMRVERKHNDIPLVIHCSAGCGRTGTICAIDYAWTLLNQGKIGKDFSLFEIILKMREQRQSMVQTPDQYELVHLVMENLFTEWIKNYELNNDVDTEQLYYNVNPEEERQEEEIYVNEDLQEDDNIYTECDDRNNPTIPKPVVVPTIPKPVVVPTKPNYDNITVPTKPNYDNITVPTKPNYDNITVNQSHQSTAQNSDRLIQVYINDDSARKRSDSSSSSLNESTVVDNMYSMVDTHKKEMERPAAKTTIIATKNSADLQQQGQGIPQLPPRNYTDEEIRSTKPDMMSSRPQQALPDNQSRGAKPVDGPRRHAGKSSNQSTPTGTVTSHSHGLRSPYPQKPLFKSVVNVGSRSAGVRHQPQQPTQNFKLKVGKEEIILPSQSSQVPSRMVSSHTVPSHMVAPHMVAPHMGQTGMAYPEIYRIDNTSLVRRYHGQPIGYYYRTDRTPRGGRKPNNFDLISRKDGFHH